MSKILQYVIGVLLGLVIILGISLGVFMGPLFQADEMLARIVVENVVEGNCYLVSLEIQPDNNEKKRDKILNRQPICGDFLGIGYEFTLPEKAFAIMKKPGIIITNLVAFEGKNRDQSGNIGVGRYKIGVMEAFRDLVGKTLKKTPMVKSITYDIKALMQRPKEGAIITYKLEPLRQQVIVECEGCEE